MDSLVLMVVSMALMDSVDPCFFILYAGILASYSMGGLRKITEVALVFISSVFTGYWVFGFLLRGVLRTLPFTPVHLSIIMLIYGVLMVAYGLVSLRRRSDGSGTVCRDDMVECGLTNRLGLRRLAEAGGAVYVAVTGFIASFTLLPCSAGMYIVYNVLMSGAPLWLWIPYTLLYVALFVSPLVLLTLVFVGMARTRIIERLARHQGIIRVLGGLTAILVATYIYYQYH
ncbi:electron transporter [Desulfurococcus mucosus]|uniref:Transmembrane electron transport protein n=1 Tax=Desulfurococcus mucosus (strain ATCC 35584 / DSM 2162 / JCM 9187 / O7/1) TaxID=765177 RepID=E8R991_DESM0|nr:electron transporter [Desulfurococcus mucosus]ADV65067.1 transmembrane electron transport protein [Desulfurococcus mucosus DSM 2162]